MTHLRGFPRRLITFAGALVAALLLFVASVAPALAEVGDGDGLDGDELTIPLVVVAVVAVLAVGSFTYMRRRRS